MVEDESKLVRGPFRFDNLILYVHESGQLLARRKDMDGPFAHSVHDVKDEPVKLEALKKANMNVLVESAQRQRMQLPTGAVLFRTGPFSNDERLTRSPQIHYQLVVEWGQPNLQDETSPAKPQPGNGLARVKSVRVS